MKHSEAVDLITRPDFKPTGIQFWADLGCGTGIFTNALADILEPDSKIVTIDTDAMAMRILPAEFNGVKIEKKQLDFVKDELPLQDLDGILMANSLHYVEDKASFILKIKVCMKENHSFLMVEYDIDKANPWVPYPIPFAALKQLFTDAGYNAITKLNTMPSVYNSGQMYSALIK